MKNPQTYLTRAHERGWQVILPGALRIEPAPAPAQLKLFAHSVQAGFPSPADDHLQNVISLDQELIVNPASTFLIRVSGCSMEEDGVKDGDVLIVDRSLTARRVEIVIAVVDGALTVKRLEVRGKRIFLVPANREYPEIEIKEGMELSIWGVVTWSIRKHRSA